MAFMEPEIFKDRVVTLTDIHGESTCIPFCQLEPLEQGAAVLLDMFEEGLDDEQEEVLTAIKLLSKYMESTAALDRVDISTKEVWVGRLSAPGYLDCTPWTWETNRKRLVQELRD